MRKYLKSTKGLTLVALIVTIIVLLILAGIAVTTISRGKWLAWKSSNC